MGLWYTEKQTDHFGITVKVKETLHSEQTNFQKLEVVKTEEFGNMLLLDGLVMTTERDEFTYHEMITHPALFTHPNPRHVLVVGGGDGGTVREVLKHPLVEKVTQVEIDQKVIEYSKKFLPSISIGYEDPLVDVIVGDGFLHIHENKAKYDVILVDSTEPIGPSAKLFELGFFQGIYESLKEDGIFVAQSDNPWFKPDLIKTVFQDVFEIFPITRLYTANIPTYPSGLWSFTLGSKEYDPLQVEVEIPQDMELSYYTANIHYAAFQLPRFMQELIKIRTLKRV